MPSAADSFLVQNRVWLIDCLVTGKDVVEKALGVRAIDDDGAVVISARCAYNVRSEKAVISMETSDVQRSAIRGYLESCGMRSVKIVEASLVDSLKSVMAWCVVDGFVLLSFEDKPAKRSFDGGEEGCTQSKILRTAASLLQDGSTELQEVSGTAIDGMAGGVNAAIDMNDTVAQNQVQLISVMQSLPGILTEAIARPLQTQVVDLCTVTARSTQACMDQLDNLKEQVRELKAEKDILRNQLSVQLQESVEVNERQRFQISQLHKQRDQLIERNTVLLEEKVGAPISADAAKIASLEAIIKNQRTALNMLNIKKEEATVALVRSETRNKELVKERDAMGKRLAELLGAGK